MSFVFDIPTGKFIIGNEGRPLPPPQETLYKSNVVLNHLLQMHRNGSLTFDQLSERLEALFNQTCSYDTEGPIDLDRICRLLGVEQL